MPRKSARKTRKLPSSETLTWHDGDMFLLAINHLLGTVKGSAETKATAFLLLNYQPEYDAACPGVPERVRNLPSAKGFHRRLKELETALDRTKSALCPLLRFLETEINERKGFLKYGSAYRHYTKARTGLRQFHQKLKEMGLKLTENAQVLPEGTLQELAGQVRVLVQLRDKAYRRREVKRKARERIGPKSQRITPIDEDREAVEREFANRSYEARKKLNAFLDEHEANYRLLLQGNLERLPCEGRPVNPYFRQYLEPFIDYLCNPKPSFTLSVCEECGSIYMRRPKDTTGRYCGEKCRKRAYNSRKAGSAKPDETVP